MNAPARPRPPLRPRVPSALAAVLLGLSFAACSTLTDDEQREDCTGFSAWQGSPYVLPYPTGRAYLNRQGNCSTPGNGHRGVNRYGYDFEMPIGTVVTAAREGTILHVVESHLDGEVAYTGFDNLLVVGHPDGTADLYGHFTHDGVLVEAGAVVQAGDTLGFSGNTGNTGNVPHLHFSAHVCDPLNPRLGGNTGCPSAPVTFRNTAPNPEGLQAGRTYTAGGL